MVLVTIFSGLYLLIGYYLGLHNVFKKYKNSNILETSEYKKESILRYFFYFFFFWIIIYFVELLLLLLEKFELAIYKLREFIFEKIKEKVKSKK